MNIYHSSKCPKPRCTRYSSNSGGQRYKRFRIYSPRSTLKEVGIGYTGTNWLLSGNCSTEGNTKGAIKIMQKAGKHLRQIWSWGTWGRCKTWGVETDSKGLLILSKDIRFTDWIIFERISRKKSWGKKRLVITIKIQRKKKRINQS